MLDIKCDHLGTHHYNTLKLFTFTVPDIGVRVVDRFPPAGVEVEVALAGVVVAVKVRV